MFNFLLTILNLMLRYFKFIGDALDTFCTYLVLLTVTGLFSLT